MKKEIQQAIFTAFDNVPYPGDDNIGNPLGRDDAENVAEAFRGLDWRSLAFKRLNGIALLFMTPEALHYYLPAYLLSAVEEVGGQEMRGLCFCLRAEQSKYSSVEGEKKIFTSSLSISLFSSNQRQVVVDVLTYGQNEIVNFLVREREADLSQDVDEYGDPITDQEKKNDRDYWNKRINTVISEFSSVIEYWRCV